LSNQFNVSNFRRINFDCKKDKLKVKKKENFYAAKRKLRFENTF